MRGPATLALIFVVLCATAGPARAISCVPYARATTGIDIRGDAWLWWKAAAGQYERGGKPREGAVLVLEPQGTMVRGHVAVVRSVDSNRVIRVDHANWAPVGTPGRGQVETSVRVTDVSPANDWSLVKVWYGPAMDYGLTSYRVSGFIYGRPASAEKRARAGESHFPRPAFAVESGRWGSWNDITAAGRFARR